MASLLSTSSDDSNVILPPPKKRWSCAAPHAAHGLPAASSSKAAVPSKSGRQKRPSRTSSWKMRETCNDPVDDPTASEVDVAQTLLRLTPYPSKRRRRSLGGTPLRLAQPEGLPALFGSAKEVEAARKATLARSQRSQPSGKETTSAAPMQTSSEKGSPVSNHPTLTTSGTLLLNAPYLLIPGISQSSPMALTEHPFHHNLNNLHAAAGKLTELVRQGQVPPPLLAQLRSQVPPAVFQPEFHQEIEQVRAGKRERLLIKAPVPLFVQKRMT